MDWKEKTLDTIIVGFFTLVGSWLIKKIKPFFGGVKNIKDVPEKLKKIEKDRDILEGTISALIRLSDDAIFVCVADGSCIFVNDALCDLFGAQYNDMMGFGWAHFILKEEREAVHQAWDAGIKYNKMVAGEYTMVNGVTLEKIKCEYTAVVHRVRGKVVTIFGMVKRVN